MDITNELMSFLGDDIEVVVPEVEETTVEEIDESEVDEQEDVLDVEEASDDEEEFEEMDEDDEDLEDDENEEDLGDDEVEDETDEEPEEFELTLEGEVVRVTKDELTSGYMRGKDYQAKVAEAEERVEKLKQEEAALMKSQEVFAFSSLKQLNEFEAAIQAEGGWLNIERTRDPVQVAQFKEMYQNVQNQAKLAEQVQAEFKAAQEKSFEEDMTKVAKHLVKTVPNMTKETFAELDSYVASVGITAEYAKTIRDPIAWTLIHKAMMYDKAQVRKVEASNKAPKRVKKNVSPRKEQPVTASRRSLDKKLAELKNTRADKERNSEVARSAIADLLKMGM